MTHKHSIALIIALWLLAVLLPTALNPLPVSAEVWHAWAECDEYGDDYLEPLGQVDHTTYRRGFQYQPTCNYTFPDFVELSNMSFETGSPPDQWLVIAGNWLLTAIPYKGTNAVSVTSIADTHVNLYQFAPDIDLIKGHDVFLGCWVKTDAARGRVLAKDDNGNVCVSAKHTGSNEWEFLSCTGTVSPDATYCKFYCHVGYTGAVDTFLWDSYIVIADDELLAVWDDTYSAWPADDEFTMTIDGVEADTAYSIRAFGQAWDTSFSYSKVICCATSGGSQDFPLWLLAFLGVIAILGWFSKSILLAIVGILVCIVSYAWAAMSLDDVSLWGASAYFLLIIAWFIFSLIYREFKKGE